MFRRGYVNIQYVKIYFRFIALKIKEINDRREGNNKY